MIDDICFCASEKCPIREYCYRGIGIKAGIYTISYLGEVCNHANIFAYFMQADSKTIEEYRKKKGDKKC